ncbi:MAG: hypothetical protein M5U21_02785 [Fimbriimonadaceae bacterium]|nr:hypothetical protein [Fimbriimonadaceae bacterium]
MSIERDVVEVAIREMVEEHRRSIPKVSGKIIHDKSNWFAFLGATVVGVICLAFIGPHIGIVALGGGVAGAVPLGLIGSTLGGLTGKLVGQKFKERTDVALTARLSESMNRVALPASVLRALGLPTSQSDSENGSAT